MLSGMHWDIFELYYNDYKQVSIWIARHMDYYNISFHAVGIRVHDDMIRAKYPHEWHDDNKTNILLCHNTGVILCKRLLERKIKNTRVPLFGNLNRSKSIGLTLDTERGTLWLSRAGCNSRIVGTGIDGEYICFFMSDFK